MFLACWAFTDTQWQIDSLDILTCKFGSLSSALTWPWRFAISWWISTVLWCHGDLRVQTTHSHLHYFALCSKTTPNKQQATKPCKMAMNWAQVTQKKTTICASLRKYNLLLHYTHISVEYLCRISHRKSKNSL